jgi:hypothetical protein
VCFFPPRTCAGTTIKVEIAADDFKKSLLEWFMIISRILFKGRKALRLYPIQIDYWILVIGYWLLVIGY